MFPNMEVQFEIKKGGDYNDDCVISELNMNMSRIMCYCHFKRRNKHPRRNFLPSILSCELHTDREYDITFPLYLI